MLVIKYFTLWLTNWFLRNNGDDTKYVYEYLLTVPLQAQMITVHSKPFYKHRGIGFRQMTSDVLIYLDVS